VDIVGEELNSGHSACMLFQVGHELARPDLPNSDFTLHATRADELAVGGETDSGDTALVSIIDLPQLTAVVNSIGTNLAIGPATNDHFLGEDCAVGEYTVSTSVALSGRRLCDATRSD